MKCPKCEERMEVNVKNEKYTCECGNEIKWAKDNDIEDGIY